MVETTKVDWQDFVSPEMVELRQREKCRSTPWFLARVTEETGVP